VTENIVEKGWLRARNDDMWKGGGTAKLIRGSER
jgi:hypothetical protein